ncbi:glycosyltransferase family protein [Aeoliella mucimassa]|uniref:Glucosyl-3-phosphoglycerate synthase n=1 Tax=Aeoliella mucimassa TaxID=2527972 RepID=A0A518AUP3_9BACT|nr:glycosyl transferase [Aeoliella mucimassa]QDU58437.1 Glucosyl-3-phosphoglycerate synthase [Aeoliella mucimassa]
MPDFSQYGPITTIHELGTVDAAELEHKLNVAVREFPIGLVLPITAADMKAEPFANIARKLVDAKFIDSIVVVLNRTTSADEYKQTYSFTEQLGDRCRILWTDGPRGQQLYQELTDAGFDVSRPGKGRAVWTAFGYLLADPKIKAYVLQDCDIVNYDNDMLMRLCLPMAHPSLDFDFCKAYYARCTDRMHGRVARLLMTPITRAMISVLGSDKFLVFVRSFRYPLAGEFAVSSALARSNRIPCDWGLEVGTLAEVFRNTSPKRVCQVDLGRAYEHKHQPLSLDDRSRGLMGMASDILTSILRTLMSNGLVVTRGHLLSIRNSYLRLAQDAIRQYHADALMNSLEYDRHGEEEAIEAFAEQITAAGEAVFDDPSGAMALPTWTRVVAALPDFPARLREMADKDQAEYV